MEGEKSTEISALIKNPMKVEGIKLKSEKRSKKDQGCEISGDEAEYKEHNPDTECKSNIAADDKQESSANTNDADTADVSTPMGKPDKGRYTRAIDCKSVKEARKARKSNKYKQLADCQYLDDIKTTTGDQNKQAAEETRETCADDSASSSGGYGELYEYHVYNATKYKDGKNKKFDGKNRNGKGGARKTVSFKKLVDIFEMTDAWQVYVCTSTLKTEEDQAKRRISQRNF